MQSYGTSSSVVCVCVCAVTYSGRHHSNLPTQRGIGRQTRPRHTHLRTRLQTGQPGSDRTGQPVRRAGRARQGHQRERLLGLLRNLRENRHGKLGRRETRPGSRRALRPQRRRMGRLRRRRGRRQKGTVPTTLLSFYYKLIIINSFIPNSRNTCWTTTWVVSCFGRSITTTSAASARAVSIR